MGTSQYPTAIRVGAGGRNRRKLITFCQKNQPGHVLVDAHIHIHDCFPLPQFFDAASRNFQQAARTADLPWPCDTAMLLTESSGADAYSVLTQLVRNGAKSTNKRIGRWQIDTTTESASVLAHNDTGNRMFIIAGRQIVTAEGLEVLALATDRKFNDGQSIRATLSEVTSAGAIPVLPWGFGKWFGRRGQVLSGLLEEISDMPFLLGDTSHRLGVLPPPDEFRMAAEKGVSILPGTDPLPFASQVSRPGAYGFRIAGRLSRETPAADLKELIGSTDAIPYGRGEGLFRFLMNQVAMQIRKRLHAQSPAARDGRA